MSISEWVGKSTYLLAISGTGMLIAAVIVSYVVYDPEKDNQPDTDSDNVSETDD